MEIKKRIRKEVLSKRRALTDAECTQKSRMIVSAIQSQKSFQDADTILAYVDAKKEVQTGELIRLCWELGKKVAVPKVHGEIMKFYYITSMEQLKPGYFGILEPEDCPLAEPDHALVIVPGVAFDRQLQRIGYGKGYYDRYLSEHADVETIAIAYELQLVDEVPTEGTDIPLHMLITEKQVYTND